MCADKPVNTGDKVSLYCFQGSVMCADKPVNTGDKIQLVSHLEQGLLHFTVK